MKRILITGANKGIGLATVKKLLESYSDTYVLLGSRDLSRGQHTLNELVNSNQQWNDRIDLIKIDVEQDDSVNSAAEEVAEKFGKNAGTLYGIVNNAGIGNSTSGMNKILQVNTYGIKRVCEVFIPLLDTTAGRIVNVTSASGPMFLAGCSEKVKRLLTNPEVNWAEIETFMNESLKASSESGETVGQSSGLGTAYGLSKACTNAYTIYLARQIPNLIINACTPGFIETDLTRPMAEAGGKTPAEMGMKSPEEGASASIFC